MVDNEHKGSWITSKSTLPQGQLQSLVLFQRQRNRERETAKSSGTTMGQIRK